MLTKLARAWIELNDGSGCAESCLSVSALDCTTVARQDVNTTTGKRVEIAILHSESDLPESMDTWDPLAAIREDVAE